MDDCNHVLIINIKQITNMIFVSSFQCRISGWKGVFYPIHDVVFVITRVEANEDCKIGPAFGVMRL